MGNTFTFAFAVIFCYLHAVNGKQLQCVCGVQAIQPRGIGETVTQPHSFMKWLARIHLKQAKDRPDCWGSVLNDKYILTSAHCVSDIVNPNGLQVSVGTEFAKESAGLLEVEAILVHPNFTTRSVHRMGSDSVQLTTVLNDLALVKLRQPLTFSRTSNVGPICLPKKAQIDTFDRENLVYMGWVTENDGETKRNFLSQFSRPSVDALKCFDKYGSLLFTPDHLCASQTTRNAHCNGEDGAPLMSVKQGLTYQVGLNYYSTIDCSSFRKEMMYLKIDSYLGWISDNTQDAGYCAVL